MILVKIYELLIIYFFELGRLIWKIKEYINLGEHKPYYMRGLKEFDNDKMFLIDTIKNEQDMYEKICNELLNFDI